MGLSNCTRVQLAVEGITEPEDFKEYNKDGMTAIFRNLFKPPMVPITGMANIPAGCLHEIQAFKMLAKSKM
jgi:hypothetical protein